jgi:N4-gp56 family major capsid protein
MITSAQLASQTQRKYSKDLLERAKPIFVMDKMVKLLDLEMRDGKASMRLFRPKATNLNDVQNLTEGIPPTQFSTVDWEVVDIDLTQVGEPYRISDIASWTQLHKIKDQVIDDSAEKAAKKYERRIQEAASAASGTGFLKRYPRALATKTFAGLDAETTAANFKATVTDLLDNVTELRRNSAPTKNGSYDANVPAEMENDLLQDSLYQNLKTQGDSQKGDIVAGQFKQLHGVRVRTGNFSFREVTEGAYSDNGVIVSAYFCGAAAIAAVRLSGQPIQNPQIIVVDKPDSGNPLAQFMSVGWKAYYGEKVTNPRFGTHFRAKYSWTAGA